MPISENGGTGICIGAAINDLKPILVHQRMDFSLYSADQIINNAAKWYSMFGGQNSVPLVIRMIIGRGWGQGNQHSQNLTALYAHVPGLKIFFPTNATDAYYLFLKAVQDSNPVLFIEHRWLYDTVSEFPGKPKTIFKPADVDILAIGYAAIEARKAKEALKGIINVNVIDIQEIKPLGKYELAANKFVVVDDAWRFGGLGGEIGMHLYEMGAERVIRVTCPDYPSGSSPALTRNYYPDANKIINAVERLVGKPLVAEFAPRKHHDVPDENFRGPF